MFEAKVWRANCCFPRLDLGSMSSILHMCPAQRIRRWRCHSSPSASPFVVQALFVSLSSIFLCMCLAHRSLLHAVFSFCQPLLLSRLTSSVSPQSFSVCVLPIAVCSTLFSPSASHCCCPGSLRQSLLNLSLYVSCPSQSAPRCFLLLPATVVVQALFVSLSSICLCMCLAHRSLLHVVFSFCQPLLLSRLSSSVSPQSFSVCVLPIAVCSTLFSPSASHCCCPGSLRQSLLNLSLCVSCPSQSAPRCLLLLPATVVVQAHFVSLSSIFLCMCLAHRSLLHAVFSFCQPLLLSRLSSSVSPQSFSVCVLPIAVCSTLFSPSASHCCCPGSLRQSLLNLSPCVSCPSQSAQRCFLVSLDILSEPSKIKRLCKCQCSQPIYTSWYHEGFKQFSTLPFLQLSVPCINIIVNCTIGFYISLLLHCCQRHKMSTLLALFYRWWSRVPTAVTEAASSNGCCAS